MMQAAFSAVGVFMGVTEGGFASALAVEPQSSRQSIAFSGSGGLPALYFPDIGR
jgi:hypothetical protein